MLKVKLDHGAYMPERAHSSDAGLDLRTPCKCRIEGCTGGKVPSICVHTGIHIEIPTRYVGMVKSKSGLNVKHGLTAEGVIDAGYTGSIVVKLYNHSSEPYEFSAGDKIAQLVIVPCLLDGCELVDSLEETERGNGGFGSTGK